MKLSDLTHLRRSRCSSLLSPLFESGWTTIKQSLIFTFYHQCCQWKHLPLPPSNSDCCFSFVLDPARNLRSIGASVFQHKHQPPRGWGVVNTSAWIRDKQVSFIFTSNHNTSVRFKWRPALRVIRVLIRDHLQLCSKLAKILDRILFIFTRWANWTRIFHRRGQGRHDPGGNNHLTFNLINCYLLAVGLLGFRCCSLACRTMGKSITKRLPILTTKVRGSV